MSIGVRQFAGSAYIQSHLDWIQVIKRQICFCGPSLLKVLWIFKRLKFFSDGFKIRYLLIDMLHYHTWKSSNFNYSWVDNNKQRSRTIRHWTIMLASEIWKWLVDKIGMYSTRILFIMARPKMLCMLGSVIHDTPPYQKVLWNILVKTYENQWCR